MLIPKLVLFLLMLAAVFAGYAIYRFWNRKINPRSSFLHFLFWIILNSLTVFIMVFLFAWVIFSFRGFFFK